MSSLGRRAMKKTLKRLREIAFADLKLCTKTFGELLERKSDMPEGEQSLYNLLFSVTHSSMKSSLNYIQALQDFSGELDEKWDELGEKWDELGEKWDKLLKPQEQTQQAKPDTKPDKKKLSYRA